MMFNVGKCKVMHFGRSNPGNIYSMKNQVLEHTNLEKDLGVVITSDFKSSQQCTQAYTKANKILGTIKRTIAYKSTGILLQLYKSLVRPHLEYCTAAWTPGPHYQKDKKLLERIQRPVYDNFHMR